MVIDAVVVGQVARDLVLLVDQVPPEGGTTPVSARREMLGGKGAKLAVALAQPGMRSAVLGVVGADHVADRLVRRAADRGPQRAHAAPAGAGDVRGPPRGGRGFLDHLDHAS